MHLLNVGQGEAVLYLFGVFVEVPLEVFWGQFEVALLVEHFGFPRGVDFLLLEVALDG
jgi:hypothetical protein